MPPEQMELWVRIFEIKEVLSGLRGEEGGGVRRVRWWGESLALSSSPWLSFLEDTWKSMLQVPVWGGGFILL